MAKDKFHQAIFLVPIILMVLKTCLAHNCKNGSEETTKITAANNIFKVNQKYEKYSNGRDYQLDMKLPRSRSNAGDKDGEGATRDRSRLWPEGIVPYLIGYNLMRHKDRVKAIEAAMQEWEQQTCIKFKKLEREANYVEIEDGDGCSSEVGMEGGRQSISLGRGCYSHGTILHELGHLLGFYHEQNRPDRDDYVEILEDNIQERFKYAFAKYQWHKIDSRSVPYDYESIMHYGANDFSIDKFRLPTIRSLDPRVKDFGNNHLSPLDIKQINLMYNCSEKNPKFPEDFTWSNNGRTIDGECVRIFEPREHRKTGWADNFLCQHKGKKNIGFRWSPNGPLDNMRCTKISLPSKPARLTWTDNYLCVPHESVFKLYWSTNGPLVNKSCLKITEPRDRVWIRANPYLCAEVASIDGVWSQWDPWDKCNRECGGGIQSRRRTCTNPPPSNGGRYCAGDSSETRICNSDPCSAWPHFPGDFTFGYFTYPPLDKYCIRMYERFHFMGSDPYFCSDGSMRDLDMRWSDRGAFSGMRCTQILKPGRFSWDDNYLCIDQDAPYRFKWSYQGSIHGLPCMKFEADKLDGWKSKNHYLCLENPQVKNGSASERHRRVNGRWSPWKPWSPCSLSCNTGWQSRVRTCSNPAPRNGGKDCTGPKSEVRLCNKKPCPAVCGGKETGGNGIIKSPSYPASYPHGSSCKWTITVARGQVVKLTFNAFRLYRGRRGCDADRVTVKDGASVRAKTLGTFCGALSLPKLLFSTSNTMTVEFLSDAQNNDVGFRASWKAETVSVDVQASKPDTGCGGDLRGNNGTFKGLVPPRKRSCNWFIIADKGRFLTVIYEVFDVTKQARSRRCRANYVELREYFDNRRVSHGRQCGPKKDVRTVFRLKTNVARIRMRSDIKNRGRGITVRWSSHAQESLAANRKG